jgi:hypothetical protein
MEIRLMPPLERSLQKSVLDHLKRLSETDPTLVYRKRHGTVMGVRGDPDIYGLWSGIHFEIELKRPGEEPTVLQRARHQEWGVAGAFGFVVHSMPELRAALEELATKLKCT